MFGRLFKSIIVISLVFICFLRVYALDLADVSPETLEIMRNNPSLMEKYQEQFNSARNQSDNKTGKNNISDRNNLIRNNQINNYDNLTEEDYRRYPHLRNLQRFDNGTQFPALDNETTIFPPKPPVSDPFVKKQLRYMSDSETKMIGVFGFVKYPNKYKVDQNFNILDSIAEAGGPLELEKLQKISVYRRGAEVADFTYTPKNTYRMSQYPLQDNDTIILEGRYEELEDNKTEETEPLEIFGHNIFRSTENFIPDQNAINFSEYVLGPGDRLQVYMWGRISKTLSLPVNADGSVISAETGRIQVSGKRFEDVANTIKGILESMEGVYSEVLVENVRSIRVLVLGEVSRPGYYTVSSFNNISSAIVIAGGLTERANIRNVQVKNSGNTVGTIDFYNLIINGDSSADFLLRPGDTVFVPRTTMRVTLEGKVRTPAIYDLKGGETLSDLFRFAGGIEASGYKKNIFLRSINDEGKVVTKSYIYGTNLKNAKLRDGDKVFVMESDIPDSNSVELKGNVYFTGMYSISEGARLSDILSSKDMFKRNTALEYGYIERYTGEGKTKQIIGFDLGEVLKNPQNHGNNIEVQAMDVINILTAEQVKAQHFVNVSGEVNAAGKYKMPEIANVMDAIMKAGGFAVDASMESIEVVRKIGGKFYTRFVDAETARKLELNADDSIVVHSKYADSPKGYVEVDGEVNNSGSYLLSVNLSVSDLIKKAGGLKKEAYKDVAHLFRIKDESFNYSLTRISLSEAMNGSPENNLILRDGDKLFVHSVFEFNPKKTISINGAVNVPGKYIYATDMNIKDLIISAGNLKDNAYYDSAEIVRMAIVDGVTKYSVIDVNLNEVMKDKYNVKLHPYDQVYIKEVSGFRENMLVKVSGEVLFPGEYAIAKGERISNLLKRAGGTTDYAYFNGMKFLRESTRQIEEENLKEMKIRLESMVTAMQSQDIAASLSAQDIAANESLSKNLENTIKKLDELEPEGRVVIDAANIAELEKSTYDFELENGDEIYIPARKATVTIVGEVYRATSFAYDKSKSTVSDYLNRSGGMTDIADKNNIYVVRANGSVVSNQFIKNNFWWKDIHDVKLNAGDVVVVPRRLKFPSYMGDIKDITQILYQIATAFAVTKVMF